MARRDGPSVAGRGRDVHRGRHRRAGIARRPPYCRGAGHRGSAHVSWLLPSALAIAGVSALVATALHFIARSRPLAESLPTARFVPHRPVRARARSIALSDVLLLVVRTAAVLALGAAVAGPVFAGARGRVRRIVALDRSRDVG